MASAPQTQTAGWLDELASVEQEVRGSLEPLSEAQFQWRPGPNRWSVGECLDHLAITGDLVLRNMRPTLDRARVEGITGAGPFKYGLLGGWFARQMEPLPPGKRGMKSPVNFVPPSGLAKSAVLGKFYAMLEDLRHALESAEGLALDRLKSPSTAKGAGWLRLNLAAWFAATLAHNRRHVVQARRVTETPGFPAA